jgi:hypothetical protein
MNAIVIWLGFHIWWNYSIPVSFRSAQSLTHTHKSVKFIIWTKSKVFFGTFPSFSSFYFAYLPILYTLMIQSHELHKYCTASSIASWMSHLISSWPGPLPGGWPLGAMENFEYNWFHSTTATNEMWTPNSLRVRNYCKKWSWLVAMN